MIFIIIFITLFIISSPIRAQELIPYQNNPVVLNPTGHSGIGQPFVLKEGDLFSLWYADFTSSGAHIIRTQSANGIDWYNKIDTMVTNRKNAADPFIFLENSVYTLYFSSSNYGNLSIWESKSTDGITFIFGNEREILRPQYAWEGGDVSTPSVIKENNLYYLFYGGNGIQNWGMGLATSSDGQNWQKCANNPYISGGVSPQIVKYKNVFYHYFHSPNGFEVQQTNQLNGCNTIWTNRHPISIPLVDPAPLVVGGDLWIYGSMSHQSGGAVGLITNAPIQAPQYPIVIIPGLFASWNKDAILHNTDVAYDAWKLQPGVMEYNALSKTLENTGRIKNLDYFIFAYDWRKPITQIVSHLDEYLTNNIWNNKPYQPVQLVGHSLGGMVSRIYTDQNPDKPVKQIISVGSPHLGAVQAYKPLVAGEIDRENSLMWVAQKLILLLNKTSLQSDKDTISQKFPVLFDILPSFPFLKRNDGTSITSLLTNTLFSQNPIKPSPRIPQVYLGANAIQTPGGLILGSRTAIDSLWGTYVDGHPQSSWTESGDGTVLAKSSLNQISPVPTQNHGEIVYAKENIKTILLNLGVPLQDSQIAPGTSTSIFPAILAFIRSPATMEITHNGVTTLENDGMIYLQNTSDGTYSLKVSGQSAGEYTVNVWLIGANDDKWFEFKKQTTQGKIDEYDISFEENSGGSVFEHLHPSPPPPCAVQPAVVPDPLNLNQSSSSEVNVTWRTVIGATGYEISWGLNSIADDKGSKSVGLTSETNVGGLDLNTKRYYFKLRSVKDCAKSDWNGIRSIGMGNALFVNPTGTPIPGQALGRSTFTTQGLVRGAQKNTITPTVISYSIPSLTGEPEVNGVLTTNTCNLIWWQILLAEALIMGIYMKKYAKKVSIKKHVCCMVIGIFITFVVFRLINMCLTYSHLIFANTPSLFGRCFFVIDALVILIIWFVMGKKGIVRRVF